MTLIRLKIRSVAAAEGGDSTVVYPVPSLNKSEPDVIIPVRAMIDRMLGRINRAVEVYRIKEDFEIEADVIKLDKPLSKNSRTRTFSERNG